MMFSRLFLRPDSMVRGSAARTAFSYSRSITTAAAARPGKWGKVAKLAVAGFVVATSSTLLLTSDADIPEQEKTGQGDTLNFRDAKNAFKSKSNAELLRSLLVFKLCSFPWLVNSSDTILRISDKLRLTFITNNILRISFFKQFCAGEESTAVKETVEKLASNGLASVLDLSMEVNEGAQVTDEMCDSVTDKIIECIDVAAMEPNTFAAVKVTPLSKPEILIRATNMLNYIRNTFKMLDADMTGNLSLIQFTKGLHNMGYKLTEKEMNHLFHRFDVNKDGQVDLLDFEAALPITNPSVRAFFQSENRVNVHCDEKRIWMTKAEEDQKDSVAPLVYEPPSWSEDDITELHALIARMDRICTAAQKKNVRLMIDAEQTYFQPCIDLMAFTMARKFNVETPMIFNTNQMYLKNALSKLKLDYTRSQREGLCFGLKMVRGAYMLSERQRAEELNLFDPICNTKQDTDNNYNTGVRFVLEQVANSQKDPNVKPVMYMIASHNENTILAAVRHMKELGILAKSDAVYFGQLMGMCDYISLTLADQAFNIAKYVPYGPINETIPYLIRRAQENSTVLNSTMTERGMLWTEFRRRILSSMLPQSTLLSQATKQSS